MFEDFHQAIYSHLFYQWICLNQSTYQKDHVLFERSHQDEDCQILLFQMEKVIGKIMTWKQNIVEEEIQNKKELEELEKLEQEDGKNLGGEKNGI